MELSDGLGAENYYRVKNRFFISKLHGELMKDNKEETNDDTGTSDKASWSTRKRVIVIVLLTLCIASIPIMRDYAYSLRCEICRQTKGETCLWVLRAGCFKTIHLPPIGMEPENL